MFDREQILREISDLSKAAYGFRMRTRWEALSDAELQAEWDRLCLAAEDADKHAREDELRCQRVWEQRIAAFQQDFAISKVDAIRWDMQANDLDSADIGQYCWLIGISFEWEGKILQILRTNS